MAKSNAVKRLERLLNDEDYGPKLVRLKRADEARVLDLIDQNRGREARKEILRLDEQRRSNARERRQSRKAPVINIETLRKQAYAKMRRSFVNSHPMRLKRNLSYATGPDLQYIVDATPDQIRDRAREPAVEYPDIDIEINPFWYK